MAISLEEAINKGLTKMRAKAAGISQLWEAAKPRMIAGYEGIPWIGPLRKQNYRAGVQAARHRVDPDKWATNYREKIGI